MCEGKRRSKNRYNMFLLQSTGWFKLLKEKAVQELLETLLSSGEIKVLEIHVVTLKMLLCMSAVLQQRKKATQS